MENTPPPTDAQPVFDEQTYTTLAEKLIKEHGKSTDEVRLLLTQKGLSYEEASKIVDKFEYKAPAESRGGGRDMAIGGVICLIGIILTVSNTGRIFYGAIIFGGIQFFRGVAKATGN